MPVDTPANFLVKPGPVPLSVECSWDEVTGTDVTYEIEVHANNAFTNLRGAHKYIRGDSHVIAGFRHVEIPGARTSINYSANAARLFSLPFYLRMRAHDGNEESSWANFGFVVYPPTLAGVNFTYNQATPFGNQTPTIRINNTNTVTFDNTTILHFPEFGANVQMTGMIWESANTELFDGPTFVFSNVPANAHIIDLIREHAPNKTIYISRITSGGSDYEFGAPILIQLDETENHKATSPAPEDKPSDIASATYLVVWADADQRELLNNVMAVSAAALNMLNRPAYAHSTRVDQITGTAFRVRWENGFSSLSTTQSQAITDTEIEIRLGPTGQITTITKDVTDTEHTFDSLELGNQYRWRIRHENTHGWGDYREWETVQLTRSTATAPDAPILLPGENRLTVTPQLAATQPADISLVRQEAQWKRSSASWASAGIMRYNLATGERFTVDNLEATDYDVRTRIVVQRPFEATTVNSDWSAVATATVTQPAEEETSDDTRVWLDIWERARATTISRRWALGSADHPIKIGTRRIAFGQAAVTAERLYGSGPIDEITSISVSRRLDELDNFTIVMPISARAIDACVTGRRISIQSAWHGTWRTMLEGLIQQCMAIDEPGGLAFEVRGISIGDELRQLNVGTARIYEDTSVLHIIHDLVKDAPNWTAQVDTNIATERHSPRFDGDNVLYAIRRFCKHYGYHWRIDPAERILQVGRFGNLSNHRLERVDYIAPDKQLSEQSPLLIRSMIEQTDAAEVANRVYVHGAGEGIAATTLANSTRTAPYTIQQDGDRYYIEDDASVAQHGRIDTYVQFKDIIPVTNTAKAKSDAANDLYDAAVAYLVRRKDPLRTYWTEMYAFNRDLKVGDTIAANYEARLKLEDSDVTFMRVNGNLWIYTVIESITSEGIRTSASLQTVDRVVKSPTELIVNAIESIDSREKRPIIAAGSYEYPFSGVISPGAPFEFTIELNELTLELQNVWLRLQTMPLRSTPTFVPVGGVAPSPTLTYNSNKYPQELKIEINGVDRTNDLFGVDLFGETNESVTLNYQGNLLRQYFAAKGINEAQTIRLSCRKESGTIAGELSVYQLTQAI